MYEYESAGQKSGYTIRGWERRGLGIQLGSEEKEQWVYN